MGNYIKYETVLAKKTFLSDADCWFPGIIQSHTNDPDCFSVAFDDGYYQNSIHYDFIKKRSKISHPSKPLVQMNIAKKIASEVILGTLDIRAASQLEWDYAIIAEIDIGQKKQIQVPSFWFPRDSTTFTMQLCRYKYNKAGKTWKYDVAYRKVGDDRVHQYGYIFAKDYCKAVLIQNQPHLVKMVLDFYKELK